VRPQPRRRGAGPAFAGARWRIGDAVAAAQVADLGGGEVEPRRVRRQVGHAGDECVRRQLAVAQDERGGLRQLRRRAVEDERACWRQDGAVAD